MKTETNLIKSRALLRAAVIEGQSRDKSTWGRFTEWDKRQASKRWRAWMQLDAETATNAEVAALRNGFDLRPCCSICEKFVDVVLEFSQEPEPQYECDGFNFNVCRECLQNNLDLDWTNK